ncbi:MAG: SBBP repeat-containing protein [Bacteroidota bacterium]|nr:SBBP repeat-containing protein [Bacteroidota bacterium]
MKNIIQLYVSYLIILNICYSQSSLEWGAQYDGSGNVMNVDIDGNIIVAGFSAPWWYQRSQTIKYNPNGQIIWTINNTTTLGIVGMVTDNDGNIYQSTSAAINDGIDFFTFKYDSSGVQKWVSSYDYPLYSVSEEIPTSIAVDDFRNIYVSGYGMGLGGNNDYLSVKYDSSGAELWAKRHDGTGEDQIVSNTVDFAGNLYVTGKSFKAGQGYDIITIKYLSTGALVWGTRYNSFSNAEDTPAKIIWKSGYIYVCGSSIGADSSYDYITIKYNALGVPLWQVRYSGAGNISELAKSMEVDGSGNVYVTGTHATIKYNSSGIQQWTQPHNLSNALLVLDTANNVYVSRSSGGDIQTKKYNSSGELQWTQQFNHACSDPPLIICISYSANSIATDNLNNIYVSGLSVSSFGNQGRRFLTLKYKQNDLRILSLNTLIEGFYDEQSNSMIEDTVKILLRNESTPYNIIDSAKEVVNTFGSGLFKFNNSLEGENYYLVIKHRNSIETWSSSAVAFSGDSINYNFTSSSSQAFGDNMKLKGTRWTVYSGDVNQDGLVDITDLLITDNDVLNFVQGYVAADVNGDDLVDLIDLEITDNNSYNFINVIRP